MGHARNEACIERSERRNKVWLPSMRVLKTVRVRQEARVLRILQRVFLKLRRNKFRFKFPATTVTCAL